MTSAKLKIGFHELTKTASEYQWTLYNFSSFNQPTGEYVTSREFSSNDIMWYIKLYPNGDSLESKGYISIFLYTLRKLGCIKVYTEFTISNNYNKIYKTLKCKGTYDLDKATNSQGYKKFLNRTLLKDLEDKNDILIVTVKIIYSKNTAQLEGNFLNLLQDFSSLLTKKEITDVILVSRDKTEYKAHKAILACRSKVFSAMFQHNTKEIQDNIVINIEDVDGSTLNAMLRFIYTGKLDVDIKDISRKLLIVAVKYELNDLKMMCIDYLLANMHCNNVLGLIKMAEIYSITEIGLKAKEYFIQNYQEILSVNKREKLKFLPRDILEDLLCNQVSI